MPLSSIVVIVLRLFALHWVLQAFVFLASVMAAPASEMRRWPNIAFGYGPPVIMVILAVLLWAIAGPVARFVSRGHDTNLNLGGLTRSDLYNFAFVFLGLFFILSSFGDVVNWIHYFGAASRANPKHEMPITNFYQLSRPCLTLALGLVCLLGAPHWTRKLLTHDNKVASSTTR